MQAPRNATAPKRIVIPAIKQAAPPVLRVCFGLRIFAIESQGCSPNPIPIPFLSTWACGKVHQAGRHQFGFGRLTLLRVIK
jgi:hypothetical protein